MCEVAEFTLGFEMDRYIFVFINFFTGPSCLLLTGLSRIINPKNSYGPGEFYIFDKYWSYVIMLVLIGLLDLTFVIYKDSQIITGEKKRKIKENMSASSCVKNSGKIFNMRKIFNVKKMKKR